MPRNYGGQEDNVAVAEGGVGAAARAANFAFLAAAADDELSVATRSGSVFTLGLRGVIKRVS